MAVKPKEIPSDLTLEIGAEVSPNQFLAAVRAFFGYVEEVGRLMAPEGEAPAWLVHVREGSALVGVEPAPSADPAIVRAVYARSEHGIKHLLNGDIEGSGLNEPALKCLRVLSQITGDGTKDRGLPVKVWVRRKPIVVDRSIARTIQEDWQSAYTDFGTIEGKLQAIHDRGKLEIHVRDAMFKQLVRCTFSEEMLPRVFESFRKRVEVSGLIHYRKNGTPISIEASDLATLPDDDELPTAAEVKGILRVTH
ncbi:MAG: hypothetical protein ACKVRO_10230 [Micropepsaceae bacterium]